MNSVPKDDKWKAPFISQVQFNENGHWDTTRKFQFDSLRLGKGPSDVNYRNSVIAGIIHFNVLFLFSRFAGWLLRLFLKKEIDRITTILANLGPAASLEEIGKTEAKRKEKNESINA